jgi:hypothetical protein
VDRRRVRPLDEYDRRWNKGFAVLRAFKKREGHTLVPRSHIERGFRLGQWVSVQRYDCLQGHLLPERKKRLNAIGFVWRQRDWLWERGFAALRKFKKREGHCRVAAFQIEDGVHLGHWVMVQRSHKNGMPRSRKRRLDKLGFIWRVYKKSIARSRRGRLR